MCDELTGVANANEDLCNGEGEAEADEIRDDSGDGGNNGGTEAEAERASTPAAGDGDPIRSKLFSGTDKGVALFVVRKCVRSFILNNAFDRIGSKSLCDGKMGEAEAEALETEEG